MTQQSEVGAGECIGEGDGESKKSPGGTSIVSIVVEVEGSASVDSIGESKCTVLSSLGNRS